MLLGGQPLNTYQLQKLDPLLNMNDSDYPIVGKVLNIDKYQKMYIAHMRTIIEEIFQNGWYETRAHELQDIIDTDYQSDPNTFYSYSQFLQNINSTAGGGPGSMPVVGITELMDTRTTWLLSQSEFQGTIPEITNQNYTPQTVEPYMTLWINADVADADEVFLYYRSNAYDRFTASRCMMMGIIMMELQEMEHTVSVYRQAMMILTIIFTRRILTREHSSPREHLENFMRLK